MVSKQGSLLKWTNYMHGFQERWFHLDRGVLSYSRVKEEVGSSSRGTLVVKNCKIEIGPGTNFVVYTGPNKKEGHVFQLRAHTEKERQEWITAIEMARLAMNNPTKPHASGGPNAGGTPNKTSSSAVPTLSTLPAAEEFSESEEEAESDDEDELSKLDSTSLQHTRLLGAKLISSGKLVEQLMAVTDDALVEADTLEHHHPHHSAKLKELTVKVKQLTSQIAATHGEAQQSFSKLSSEWQRTLRLNETKRKQLEENMESLAVEHRRLERQANKASIKGTLLSPEECESDKDEFFDAESINEEVRELTNDGDAIDIPPVRRASTNAQRQSIASPTSPSPQPQSPFPLVERRTMIPYKLNKKLSLWSILKNCIGKDLSKIPMPVHFNEPISFTQRLAEDLEYSAILDRAVLCSSSQERMAYVAAFTASSFANVTQRTGKPFNPLLGETFELDRRAEMGWRAIFEQVSHHPPICAFHCESEKWVFYQEFSMNSRFRGKYLEVIPTGISHVVFKETKDHYTWTKVPTTIHNIIVGKLWCDQSGSMVITNHTQGDTCSLKYFAHSYFTSSENRKVSGEVKDKAGHVYCTVEGTWDEEIKELREGKDPVSLWVRAPSHPEQEKIYGFNYFTVTLREMTAVDKGCAMTDSRLRPDVELMENGEWDKANDVKGQLEELQRTRRKAMEATQHAWSPVWFELRPNPVIPDRSTYVYKGGYWEAKESKSFSKYPIVDIYNLVPPPPPGNPLA